MIANVLVGLAILIHLYIVVLGMVLWGKPFGRKVFGFSANRGSDNWSDSARHASAADRRPKSGNEASAQSHAPNAAAADLVPDSLSPLRH
jgi:hypothetical protein